jgi:uncharacterized membrane protein
MSHGAGPASVRARSAVPVALLVAGVALVADAVLRGGATVSLVVVVPVVSGDSAEFLLGIVALVAGFLSLPFLLGEAVDPGEPTLASEPPSAAPVPSEGPTTGGLVLVGPVPIFFGSWRNVSTRTRWAVALVGALVLVLFLVGVWLALR